MARQRKCRLNLNCPNLVGTIHTRQGLAEANRLAGVLDAAELRVDAFPSPPTPAAVEALKPPLILTVRRQDEGGCRKLEDVERLSLYRKYLPLVDAIDIELRSTPAFSPLIAEAHRAKRASIISSHDFNGTPSRARLLGIVRRARDAGATVVKIATLTHTPSDAARLVELLDTPHPIAVMAMGPMGRAMRLFLASQGSVLNYAWLHKPQVPGQWSARDFHRLFRQISS